MTKIHIPSTNLNEQIYYDGSGRWIINNLIELSSDLEVQTMPIAGLNTHGLYPVLTSVQSFVDNIRRVQEVDLKYPIILDQDGYCMDGRHRIAKALLEGKETIDFVRFDITPESDYTEDTND